MLKKVVNTLTKQHKTLKKQMEMIVVLNQASVLDTAQILQQINELKTTYTEHINLENNVFYPKLLIAMEEKGLRTNKTRDFIEEMKNLGKVISSCFELSQSVSQIKKNYKQFKKCFAQAQASYLLRMESEELGVFTYATLF